jgi:hypothetical protein
MPEVTLTDDAAKTAIDEVEKGIADVLKGKPAEPAMPEAVSDMLTRRPLVQTTDRTRLAMRATDAAMEHAERAIEAALQEAIVMRITQVRGKLDIGPRDIYARDQALRWIMSIAAENAQEKPA